MSVNNNSNHVTVINQVGRRSPLPGCLTLLVAASLVVAFFTWPLYTWHGATAVAAEVAWVCLTAVFFAAVLGRTGRKF